MRTRSEREWLELAGELLQSPSTSFPEQVLAEELARTFEARGVGFSRRGPAAGLQERMWAADDQIHVEDWYRWSRQEAPRAHPLLRYYLATGDSRTLQVRDVPERFADRGVQAAFAERAAAWGAPAHAALPVRFTADSRWVFVIGRTDPFTPGELALLDVLQRLLIGLDAHVEALSRCASPSHRTPPGPDGVERARSARMTVRETAVLALLADGLTAATIARRLAVSERTVHKHLENVYRKLGVRDRLAAVLRARAMGVLASA